MVESEATSRIRKTVVGAGASNYDFEENPFGLREEANGWLQAEMLSLGEGSYLLSSNRYRPFIVTSKDSPIPGSQLHKAGVEYEKRSCSALNMKILPVLVATGVSDRTMLLFINDEAAPLKKSRYLYFPSLTWEGRKQGALFMTYMPGPTHGGVDAKFINMAETWINNNIAVETVLGTGCSSGATNAVQPDHRIYPFKKHRDKNGNDRDRAHKNLPHTRMYWEVEYDHRDIIGLRQHGARLMMRSVYTRLFLGATISKPDENSSYAAAIVLWGKDDANDAISVLDAVSFGTVDLSEESKKEWAVHRANRLPPVGVDEWRRPDNADETPVEITSPTPEEWLLQIPFTGLLYKVMTGKRNANGDYDYLLETLDDELEDMDVDLLRMSYTIFMKTPAGEASDDSASDEDE